MGCCGSVVVGRDLLGWSSAALCCAPFSEWVHPDDRDQLMGATERLLDSGDRGRFWPIELRLLGRDRQYWWTRWHLWAATSDPPTVCAAGVEHVGRDGLRGPPVGTWRWSIDDDQVVWSPELLDMFNLAVGPPSSYADFLSSVHDEDRGDVDRAVRWSLLSGDPYVTDFRAAHRRRGPGSLVPCCGAGRTGPRDRLRSAVGHRQGPQSLTQTSIIRSGQLIVRCGVRGRG